MKTTRPNWNNKTLVKMEKKETLRFDYPIQRKGGQWDRLQQSLLIHSIIGGYPIPPVLVLKATIDEESKVEYVLDGKQRTTTLLNFMAGVKDKEGNYPERAYSLHEETPTVFIEDEEYVLAGKYFDELPEDVISELNSGSFQITRLEEATDEEIEELFYRWNNGTPLSKQQKTRAVMGVEKASVIDSLVKHKFITEVAKFTPLQLRRSTDEGVILQTLMLLSGKNESFVADNLLKFSEEIRNQDISEIVKDLTETMDYIVKSGMESSGLFKPLHLPTLLLVAKKAKDEGISPIVFTAWVDDFNDAIVLKKRAKTLLQRDFDYKAKYTGAGSVKANKVQGRKEAMMKHFDEFVEKYDGYTAEPKQEKEVKVKEVKKPAKKAEVKVEEPKEEVKEEPKGEELTDEEKAKIDAELEAEIQELKLVEEMKDISKEIDKVTK